LPLGSIVYETNIPDQSLSGSAIALKPIGGTTANQKLLIYPTANDGDHIHMTSGNLYATELFLGSDNLYVKLANTGNVVINSNDAVGNSAQWTFDVDGVVSFPRDAAGNSDPFLTIQGGSNPGITSTDVSLMGPANLSISSDYTKFSGFTGNTVQIYADNGEILGDANLVLITNNSNVGNTLSWTFGTDGTLTFPNSDAAIVPDLGGTTAFQGAANTGVVMTSSGNAGSVTMSWVDRTTDLANARTASMTLNSAGTGTANAQIQVANLGANAINNWTFDNTGNLTLPGNSFAVKYANGTAVSLGGSYGNANVADFLDSLGSNNISTTGNITAGNLSVTGNVIGTIGFTSASITINNAPGGNEGAEIQWALPSPANTVLSTSLVQDVFQNGMRFFESGGNSRGLYMDLGNVPNGAGTAVGYRDVPQISFTGNATLAATDAGRHYYSTLATANVLTIANNTSVLWSVGTAITVVNRGSGNITIAQGSGVSLYLAGNSTAGNRTVSTYGMATLLNVAANIWMINGTGVA